MGCDIHIIKEELDGQRWHAVDMFNGRYCDGEWNAPTATSRNYARFAALAGVRGDGPAPRGPPRDASPTTRYLLQKWDDEAHSVSWLPIDEAAAIFAATEPGGLTGWEAKWPAVFYFGHESQHPESRIVFWFDN